MLLEIYISNYLSEFPSVFKRFCLCLLGAGLLAFGLFAQEIKPSFDEISRLQAAYLRNLGEYTRWPDSVQFDDRGVVIGVVGRDSKGVGRILDYGVQIVDIKIKGKVPKIVKFRDSKASGITECDILFVLASERSRVESLLKSLEGKPILTVSEISGFASKGGWSSLHRLEVQKIRVTLVLNPTISEKTGINFSSRLLGLKKGVRIIKP